MNNIYKQVKDFHSSLIVSDYITSYNLARKCDVVFAEELTPYQFDELKVDKKNIEVLKRDEKRVLYRTKKFNLSENDVIFCKTDLVPDLFSILNSESRFSNIKLLSHQAATPPINESIFKLKPKIISKWYSINVDFKHEDLIPIPLGLANEYATQNLRPNDFKKFFEENKNYINLKKEKKIYINFNKNTNILKREKMLATFLTRNDVTIKTGLSLNEFMLDMFTHKFILSPEGKGVDTHRFWEAFYLGSIPIIEDHLTYGEFLKYCISYSDYESEKYSINKELKSLNLDFSILANFLTVPYLMNKIREMKINDKDSKELSYGFKEKILKRYISKKFKSQN